ncbi:MAG: plastocyanin [Nitrososphaeraceae archaeon]|nr:plastocyanin [Nitrososphaeraceae archaeon]
MHSKIILASIVIVTAAIAAFVMTININTTNATREETASKVVQAGGGNTTISFSRFLPKDVQINAGESVLWYNPTEVSEPHTVTFVMDSKYMTDIIAPFAVSDSTEFIPLPTDANSEVVAIPNSNGTNRTNVIAALDARGFYPVVINSTNNVTYLNSNALYVIDGTEKYVNSGVILPVGQIPPGPPITTFTATFEKTGNYDYICIFHPWMTGRIIVK